MATAMTAPAAGAVVDESNRDGATAADRDLEKLNALENWAHIQSSLENKQACVASFFFWLATRRETRTNQKNVQPWRGRDDGDDDRQEKRERESDSSNLRLRLSCGDSLWYQQLTKLLFSARPAHTETGAYVPGSLHRTFLGIAALAPSCAPPSLCYFYRPCSSHLGSCLQTT